VKLSIIIPSYNSERTIVSALDSVYLQNVSNDDFEVIIINDGSTDNSLAVIESFINIRSINNIKVITQENGGVASARNTGIRISTGQYIAFLDSDDVWLPGKIRYQIDLMDSDDSISLCGGRFNSTGLDVSKFSKIADDVYVIDFKSLITRNYFQPSTVMFRSSILPSVGLFKEGMRHAEEGLFFYNIAYSYRCVFIDKLQINFGGGKSMFGESGLSGNLLSMERGELHNYLSIFRDGKISLTKYIFLVIFSLLKFIRRVIISSLIRLRKQK